MAYTVTSPLVIAHRAEGAGSVHIYEGGLLPDDVDEAQLEQLIAAEMVEETADGDKLSGKASVKAWREYAVAQGMTEEGAAAASKEDLVALYAD